MKVGDRVRFTDNDQFAVVTVLKDENRCEVKVSSGRTVVAYFAKLKPDFVIPSGSWCVCPSRNNIAMLVMGSRRKANPGPFECEYEYHFKLDTGPGLSDWINGAYLQEIRQISRPASMEEFNALLASRTPLTYFPNGFRDKGFTIAYRGDDREPSVVFKRGFQPRQEHVSVAFRTVREDDEGVHPQFDIDSRTGVCVSRKPEAAAMFPLISPEAKRTVDETWLYAFFAYQPFYTFKVQEQQANDPENARFRSYIESMLQGEEIVIGNEGIPPETVLVGFNVLRQWDSTDWTRGCTYTVRGYQRNAETFYKDDPAYDQFRRSVEGKIWDLHHRRSPRFS